MAGRRLDGGARGARRLPRRSRGSHRKLGIGGRGLQGLREKSSPTQRLLLCPKDVATARDLRSDLVVGRLIERQGGGERGWRRRGGRLARRLESLEDKVLVRLAAQAHLCRGGDALTRQEGLRRAGDLFTARTVEAHDNANEVEVGGERQAAGVQVGAQRWRLGIRVGAAAHQGQVSAHCEGTAAEARGVVTADPRGERAHHRRGDGDRFAAARAVLSYHGRLGREVATVRADTRAKRARQVVIA